MDLSLTVEEAAFRDECRNWLRGNLPWDYGTGLPPLFAASPVPAWSGSRGP